MAAGAVQEYPDGFALPGFEGMADAFGERLALMDGGASFAVHVNGQSVVHLWHGPRRVAVPTVAWTPDTLVNLFSVTKTLYALCILTIVDRGLIALDAPVAMYWPEFGVHGKDAITVRQVLSHTAGVPGVSANVESLDIFDLQRICDLLEREKPWWPAGSKRGIHVQFYCHLLGELVRRVTGRSAGEFWVDELGAPLGGDVFLGVPAGEHSRIAETIVFSPQQKQAYLADPSSLLSQLMTNPPVVFDADVLNSATCWTSEACGYGTAEAIARVFDLFALVESRDGGPVSRRILREALRVQTEGYDEVLAKERRWCLGLQAFGLTGWRGIGGIGGTLAAVHPDAQTSLVFLPNAMGDWRHALVLLNLLSQQIGAGSL